MTIQVSYSDSGLFRFTHDCGHPDNISGKCGPLFSQISFDQTYFGVFCLEGGGEFGTRGFVKGAFTRGVYVL